VLLYIHEDERVINVHITLYHVLYLFGEFSCYTLVGFVWVYHCYKHDCYVVRIQLLVDVFVNDHITLPTPLDRLIVHIYVCRQGYGKMVHAPLKRYYIGMCVRILATPTW